MVGYMNSKSNFYTKLAYDIGYRVINGEVFSPYRNEKLRLSLIGVESHRYYKFRMSFKGDRQTIKVHKLVAYRKYGNKIFGDGVLVRHLDGNSLNNLDDNITIGSFSDNMFDIPKNIRTERSIKAATTLRKFTDDEMLTIREFHSGSYLETMKVFDITSKGTLHRILNTDYVTKV